MQRIARPLLLAASMAAASVLHTAAPPAATRVADSDWLAKAQQHVAQREYRASENGAGLQAPNRAHNLRTYFDVQGIRVHDRTADTGPELVRLSLSGVGRGAEIASAPAGKQVLARENRVEIRRPGILEWYENSPAGLEQGFTLDARPAGDGPLVVEIAVAGATPTRNGDAIAMHTATGRNLDYGALEVTDAAGRALASHFDLASGDRLRIVVDDAGASYPLLIDPLITQAPPTGKKLESQQALSSFGLSVASAGDVNGDGYGDVIVGAMRYDAGETDEGAAFVFLGSASGIPDGTDSSAATQLESNQGTTPPGPGSPSRFGSSVAGAGDVNGDGFDDVIVSAPYYDAVAGSGGDEGAAFVFFGSASGIADGNPGTANHSIVSEFAHGQLFTVAAAGDVNGDGYGDILVGSPFRALVFLGSASGIVGNNIATAATRLTPTVGDFIAGVVGAGDVNGDGYDDVIVGIPGFDGGQTDEGAAFIYLGSASGIPSGDATTAATRLESNQPGGSDIDGAYPVFGGPVAGAGDVNGDGFDDVIVGAPRYQTGQSKEGAAFIFLGSASGIPNGDPTTAAARLAANQEDARFGYSVASAGDVNRDGFADLLIGAPHYSFGSGYEGAAFVFLGSASGIPSGSPSAAAASLESSRYCRPPASTACLMGFSASSAGDVDGDGYGDVIVGTTIERAYVFKGSESGLAEAAVEHATPDALLEGDQDSAHIGASVAGSGDVNGDGYDDVIVGAPYYDAGQVNEGAAFVFLGGPSGIPSGAAASAATQIESDQAFANLGESVAGAGDVNGDGYADVIVGDPNYGSGAAFVFLGSASGVPDGNPANAASRLTAVPFEVCPDPASTGFGVSVAGAGDVNHDGFGDVIVGAPSYPQPSPCTPVAGPPEPGAAFVFNGSASGIADASAATAAARLVSTTPAWFGDSVAAAGDVNGDDYDDVIVGAPYYSATESDEGAAFVFLGGASGIADGGPTSASAQLESNQARAHLGSSVAGAGDVNGDGYADVIVGAPLYDVDSAVDVDDGAAFVFHGSASGVAAGSPATAATAILSDQPHAALGVSVAGVGDVNRDGHVDVLVGASRYPVSATETGAAFVYLGGPAGASSHVTVRIEGSQNEERLGASVAGAGDVDGDGANDVIVGAPNHDAGQIDEGAAFVYLPEPHALLALAAGAVLVAALKRARRA